MDVATQRRKGGLLARARTLILVGVAVDCAFAATRIIQLLRTPGVVRPLEWAGSTADGMMFLVPAVLAVVAVVRRERPLLDAAIVLNILLMVQAFPWSEFVVILLIPPILMLLGREHVGPGESARHYTLQLALAILLAAAATLLLVTAPSRHVLWSTQSRAGHVVTSQALVVKECPTALGGEVFAENDSGASGCDFEPLAWRAETAIGLWCLVLVIALVPAPRRTEGIRREVT